MQRRQALQCLLRGLTAGSLLGPAALHAQSPPASQPGRVQLGQQAGATGQQAGRLGQRPQANLQTAPEVVEQLRRWEHHTRNIQRLHGEFERYVYDSTFLVERRSEGEFWYESPDHARIDLRASTRLPDPDPDTGVRLNPLKLGTNGQPFSVQADSPSRWVCRGDALLVMDETNKTFDVLDIPPHLQGRNITASPLPFLFGINADAMQRRYNLAPGGMTTYRDRPVVHLQAGPKLEADRKEWGRAEVLLDPGTFFKDGQGQPIYIPLAIKLLDPSGQTETVYVFYPDKTKLNQTLFWGNPFRDPGLLSGYRMQSRQTIAEEPNDQQRTVESDRQSGQTN